MLGQGKKKVYYDDEFSDESSNEDNKSDFN